MLQYLAPLCINCKDGIIPRYCICTYRSHRCSRQSRDAQDLSSEVVRDHIQVLATHCPSSAISLHISPVLSATSATKYCDEYNQLLMIEEVSSSMVSMCNSRQLYLVLLYCEYPAIEIEGEYGDHRKRHERVAASSSPASVMMQYCMTVDSAPKGCTGAVNSNDEERFWRSENFELKIWSFSIPRFLLVLEKPDERWLMV